MYAQTSSSATITAPRSPTLAPNLCKHAERHTGIWCILAAFQRGAGITVLLLILVLSRFLKTENRVSRYMKGQCFITVRNDSCIDTWIDSRIVYQLFSRNLLLKYPKWIDSRFLRVRIDSALIQTIVQKIVSSVAEKWGFENVVMTFAFDAHVRQTLNF